MDHQDQRRRKRWIVPGVIALAAGTAWAAMKVCDAPLAEIRSGKRSVSEIIATIKKGEKLEVVEKDKRGWLKVKYNGKEGYVYESALEAPAGKGIFASNDPRASATELAAAGKGLTDTAIQYASSKNLSTAGLEQMLETRRKVQEADPDLKAFLSEGNLPQLAEAAPARSTRVAVAMSEPQTPQGK